MYRMKHIPTGLYYQPHKHRGSHLSKTGKVYQNNTNGIESGNYGLKHFSVWCEKGSRIHKQTESILDWQEASYHRNQLKADTRFEDWIREEI